MVGTHPNAEAHANDALFARGERSKGLRRRVAEIRLDRGVDRRHQVLVLDEITEPQVVFVADWRFERQRLFGDLEHMQHLFYRHVDLLSNLPAPPLPTPLPLPPPPSP